MRLKTGIVSAFLLLGLALVSPASAQQQGPPSDSAGMQQAVPGDQPDPEDRNHGVARISLLNGDVSVRRGDSGDQVAAGLNAPLMVQDSVLTGPASRAEIQFDAANRVRFANDTEVRFSQLTADRFQVQLARGTLTWAVLADSNPVGEIATPSVAVRPLGRGNYRVSVLPDGTSQITVRLGTLEVYTPRGVERMTAGQTMLARGAIENPEFQTSGAIAGDEWDVFNERRDRELQQSQSYNYVSRDIAGAEELDNYGQWNNDSAYGQVWTPRVAADWAPYRLGRWGYEDYYGWTWISSDPWGWAPYHYGSWFRGSYGWSWCPGPRYSHYYYRPALVAFFGYGGGVGLGFGGGGFGFGNIGWVPLAPFERYNRWYGRGFGSGYNGFGRNVNIVNNTNITNVYRNARVGNGVTGIGSREFANGNFGRYSNPSSGQLQQAGMIRGQVPFTPTSNHLRFNDRQTAVQGRANFNQTNFANHMTAPTSNYGRQSSSFTQGMTRQTSQSQGFGSFGRQGNSTPTGGSTTWQRFGSPSSSQNGSFSRQATSPSYQQNSGGSNWQRFGDPATSSQNRGFAGGGGSPYNSRTYSSGQSVQVAPPVVRQRSYSQPAYSRPAYSQPAYSQPSYRQPSSGSQPNYSQPNYSRPNYSQQSGNRTFSQPSSSGSSRPNYTPSQPSRSSSQPAYQGSSSSSHSGGGGSHESSSHGGHR